MRRYQDKLGDRGAKLCQVEAEVGSEDEGVVVDDAGRAHRDIEIREGIWLCALSQWSRK